MVSCALLHRFSSLYRANECSARVCQLIATAMAADPKDDPPPGLDRFPLPGSGLYEQGHGSRKEPGDADES